MEARAAAYSLRTGGAVVLILQRALYPSVLVLLEIPSKRPPQPYLISLNVFTG